MPDQARLHLCRTHFAPSHVERLVGPPLRKPAAVRIHAGDGSKLRASSKAPVWCTPGSPTGLARAGLARRKRPWPCPAMVRPACQETADNLRTAGDVQDGAPSTAHALEKPAVRAFTPGLAGRPQQPQRAEIEPVGTGEIGRAPVDPNSRSEPRSNPSGPE